MRNKKRIIVGVIFIAIVVFLIWRLFLINTEKTYTYHSLRVPVELEENKVSESLMNKQPIKIEKDICPQTLEMAKEDNWQILDTNHYTDGGSISYDLFKDKNQPAVAIFCKYEMALARYSETTIVFIHPARIGSWLLDLNSHPKRTMGSVERINVEQLMDCDGTIIRGQMPETVECIKE